MKHGRKSERRLSGDPAKRKTYSTFPSLRPRGPRSPCGGCEVAAHSLWTSSDGLTTTVAADGMVVGCPKSGKIANYQKRAEESETLCEIVQERIDRHRLRFNIPQLSTVAPRTASHFLLWARTLAYVSAFKDP